MPPQAIYDLGDVNFDEPLYTIDDIREVNPQRFEMEQLTAIVHVDREGHGLVGYKLVTHDEFWCRGHMPGYPLMPGVIQCEAAAQLANFYARKFKILGGDFLGFGGMDEVRFRAPVYPGSRLDLMAQVVRLRAPRRAEFAIQGFVDGTMVFSGGMIGVAISKGDT
ncbi:MAG: beta-hydroxyacyl-ACP dehydratase, partial [Planctomycetota bacterium]|nr:beta-hydroxyacyl-ACP dehydratase [Planctomycetota bacterium]